MQNSNIETTIIRIMDRDLKIKCPKSNIDELKEAASYLDNKMREIYNGDKFIPIDRITITAALNIIHDLILEKKQSKLFNENNENLEKRLLKLKNKITTVILNTKHAG